MFFWYFYTLKELQWLKSV